MNWWQCSTSALLAVWSVGNAGAQPVIVGVTHGAGGAAATRFAPGSRITILGARFGDSEGTLRFRGTSLAPRVLEWKPDRIEAVLPLALPLGEASMVAVSAAGDASEARSIEIVDRGFQLFTVNGRGFGPAIGFHERGQIRFASPARPGERIALFGTGLGRQADAVRLLIAGREVEALPGPALPEWPGVEPIEFEMPAWAREGCFSFFAIDTGSQWSQPYSLPVTRAPMERCVPEIPIGSQSWDRLDEAGSILAVVFSIQFNSAANVPLTGEAWRAVYDGAQLSALVHSDFDYFPAPAYCSNVFYTYTRFSPPPRPATYGTLLPFKVAVPSVEDATGCISRLEHSASSVLSGPIECRPERYRVGTITGEVELPEELLAAPKVSANSAGSTSDSYRLIWTGNTAGGPLTLLHQSWLTLPGSIFSGLTYMSETACRLSGSDGEANAAVSRPYPLSRWTSAAKRQVNYRVVEGMPGAGVTLIRFVRQTPVELPN